MERTTQELESTVGRTHAAWLILWLALAAGMFSYLQSVGYPDARQRMGSSGLAPDNGVGLFPPWYASREFLLKGRDPYSAAVAAETQAMVYGRSAEAVEGSLIRDEHRFAYPLYVALLLSPVVVLPFTTAQWLMLLLLIAATTMSVPWWLKGLGIRASGGMTALLVAAVFGSLAVQQGLHLQQLGLLVAAALAGALAATAKQNYVLAGVLLGMATIKPHLAAGVTAWLLLWSLGDVRRRRGLLIGFSTTLLVLVAGAVVLMPDWISRWLSVILSYSTYTGARPLVAAMFGTWGMAGAALAAALLVYSWWRARKTEAGERRFARVTLLTLGLQMLLIPTWIGHNQILLLPIALAAALQARRLWTSGPWPKVVITASVLAFAWERSSATGLALLEAADLLKDPSPLTVALPVYPLFAFPLLGLLLATVMVLNSPAAYAATK